jgi:glycosyltransferase involved in cell wall biosynthesis
LIGRKRGRLRIAVPEVVTHIPRRTGHGTVWAYALDGVREHARVEIVPEGRTPKRSPDAWLTDHRVPATAEGLPLVVQLHEAPWVDDPAVADLLHPDFVASLGADTRAAARAATRVLVPSRKAVGQIATLAEIEHERFDVVPYGVDMRIFHPRDTHAGDYVLFVGTAHPRKNLDVLREAVVRLRVPLVMVLAPPIDRDDAAAQQAAATAPLRDGRAVGVVTDPDDAALAALMRGAAAFCLPSLAEGYGLPALEALACGTPTVVSDRGALPEVVGDAALVVAPEAGAVTAALARVLGDSALAADLRRRGPARAATLSWEATAEGWMAALERAVADATLAR